MRLFVVDDTIHLPIHFRDTMTFNPHITSKRRARIAAGLRTCIVGEGRVLGHSMRLEGSMPAGADGTK